MQEIEINREPVELYKILKFEGLLASGGEAKAAVAAGLVSVNGEDETRTRRKIVSGDILVFDGHSYRITLSSAAASRI